MDNEPTLKITSGGSKRWLFNGVYHREDGPAFEGIDGRKSWWLNGKRHRVDGPACEFVDGTKYWYLNGVHYWFDSWLEANTLISEEEKVMMKLIHG
jgi:hypothetical protein